MPELLVLYLHENIGADQRHLDFFDPVTPFPDGFVHRQVMLYTCMTEFVRYFLFGARSGIYGEPL
jgi:hypothetical protein